jgi:hypothetical protein
VLDNAQGSQIKKIVEALLALKGTVRQKSHLNLNISPNSKSDLKTVQGVKQGPGGRCSMKKQEVENPRKLSL